MTQKNAEILIAVSGIGGLDKMPHAIRILSLLGLERDVQTHGV